MNKTIEIVKEFIWNKVILFCERCDTQTVHALSKDGSYYACGCGEIIQIQYKED